MRSYLDFEKPIAELESKVEELREVAARDGGVSITEEVTRLEQKADQALKDLYAGLTPWQKTLVARHPGRPHTLDYIAQLLEDFTPLAGDRVFGEDEPLSAASAGSAARASASWAMSAATRPRPASGTISAWRAPRATARRCA